MALICRAISFNSGLMINLCCPTLTCCEFKASLDVWLGGLKRDTAPNNQTWLSFSFFTWRNKYKFDFISTTLNQTGISQKKILKENICSTKNEGMSEDRETFSSSDSSCVNDSHQREPSTALAEDWPTTALVVVIGGTLILNFSK